MMFNRMNRQSIIEAAQILTFANKVAALTGADPARCLAFAMRCPPSYRDLMAAIVRLEPDELVSLEDVLSVSWSSAWWRFGLALRDLARASCGVDTVADLLKPGPDRMLKPIE